MRAVHAQLHALVGGEEDQLKQDLKDAGMEFVEVDKAAFAAKAKDAVLANVNDEIRPYVEQIFAKKQ